MYVMSVCVRMHYYVYLYMHVHSYHAHMRTHTDRWVPGLSFWGCLLYAVICVSMINTILEASVACDIAGKYGVRECVCNNMCETTCVFAL